MTNRPLTDWPHFLLLLSPFPFVAPFLISLSETDNCMFPTFVPFANLTIDRKESDPTPPPLLLYHHPSVPATEAMVRSNQESEWTPSLRRLKADSKANSHCLKWQCCPGICLTFCLMHKKESMHNPCLINIFPLCLSSPSTVSSLNKKKRENGDEYRVIWAFFWVVHKNVFSVYLRAKASQGFYDKCESL